MRELRAVALLLLAWVVGGCRGPSAQADPSTERPASAGVTVDLTPEPDKGTLAVEVRVAGELASRVRQLAMPRRWADARGADAVSQLTVRDRNGDVATRAV
ncbi:MAG TPA: hypothetical protein VHB21_18235, partial [Minicystis sp.]|nr:hypothetical protein [Minicystis sp.]